ncbi:MAG: ACP S-malonyltransferase [Firmicutes bacterium]|nr:ACP S-malonyltransferase [Bacillota bacterium]
MTKYAFIFPGQGAQFVGMGKELASEYPEAGKIFQEADEILGYNLSRIIFQGDDEMLYKTEVTQPAVLTTSVAISSVLEKEGLKPDAVAGLSLGEYSALVCAKALHFSDAILLVQKRAQLMQELIPFGKGGMAAILGLTPEEVKNICNKSLPFGHVEPANYNCPGQVVIAGHKEALEEACRLASEKKAKARMLSVSVPFHSKLLQPIKKDMISMLGKISINAPIFSFVANTSARYLKNPEDIRQSLVEQSYTPVLWEDSMKLLIGDGCNLFIETGPGRVLTGFMKRIDKNVRATHVEDKLTLYRLLKILEEVKA